MFVSKAQELRRLNLALHGKMAELSTKAANENRVLTTEEQTAWTAMDAEYLARKTEIERHETLEARERELATLDQRRAGRTDPGIPEDLRGDGRHQTPEQREKDRRALRTFIARPASEWDPETRETVKAMQANVPPEARAMGVGFVLPGLRGKTVKGEFRSAKEQRTLTAAGNTTVAEEFMDELDVAMKEYSGIMQAARIVTTDTGADMPMPTADDTGNTGALLAETNAAADTADPTIAEVVLQAFLYTSKIVRVPNQLLQDSAFDLESELAGMLGVRLGRIMNTHGTKGTGSSQPRGVITAVLADTTPVIPASATALAYADLVKLQHAVDPAYRKRPKTAWMFHDKILEVLKKLVDSDGRPLWAPSVTVGAPDRLLGHPWFINQDMDSTLVEDNESVLFGDFSKYVIRRALNPVLMRLNERYAEYFQTGFVMFERWDSDLIDAGGDPIKVISHNLA
jgi:HK97 family phage major capsid protein